MLRRSRRADALVFALALVGTGYFHQGGGWNQNSRFALVRSIVEDGTFFVDSHLVYRRAGDADATGAPGALERVPVRAGNVAIGGSEVALAWRGRSALLPVDPGSAGTRRLVAIDDVAASGDVSYFAGHFHPNKAPGPSFLAVPGYALLRAAEGLLGLDPDRWAVLTFNAWMTSVLSVGLLTAVGAVLVLRSARAFATETSARLAALAFVFATMAWPYGTMLFEHNVITAAFVAALYFVERARDARPGTVLSPAACLHAAGLCAGFAAITNYTMALLVPVFALLALARLGSSPRLAWYAVGVAWPLGAILAYNVACFGTPLTTNYAYQSAMFQTDERLLGVFAMPRLDVLALLLFSPFRGLFFTSPVLLASVAAMAAMWRARERRETVALVAVVTGFLLLVNASFNGWDGGWTAVPRYLGPAMALLALPLAFAFDRWRAPTFALAGLAFVVQFLLTAVDPQVPIGDVGTAGTAVSEVFFVDPTTRYVLPLFTTGRAWPMIDDEIDAAVARSSRLAAQRGEPASQIEQKAARLRADLRAGVERGEGTPLALAGVAGPVSANPIGVYEGYYYRLFPAGSPQASGNSFNVGELVFPRSRWSLMPLVVVAGALLALLFRDGAGSATSAAVAAASPAAVATAATKPAPATRPPEPSPPTPPRRKRRRR